MSNAPVRGRQKDAPVARALAGMLAPPVFAATVLLQDWLRADFDPRSRFISELAIGPLGWIQIANFIVHGVLCVLFAGEVRVLLRSRQVPATVATLLTVYGTATVLGGVFVADPSGGLAGEPTWHGTVHLLIGVTIFTLLPVINWASVRAIIGVPEWQPLRPWTVTTCAATAFFWLALVPGSFVPPMVELLGPSIGAINRAVFGVWLFWLFLLARAVRRERRASSVRAGVAR